MIVVTRNKQTLEDLNLLAKRLCCYLKKGDVLLLKGTLGAGKTSFAQGLIQSLAKEALEVTSPTFTLVHTYDLKIPVYHYDLYRLKHPEEVYELGFEESLMAGISLIEWPEKLGPLTPKQSLTLEITFEANPQYRTLVLSGPQEWLQEL
jgi:tRNA threonylcarbamoyladenosine biosynthesis protein TsaE